MKRTLQPLVFLMGLLFYGCGTETTPQNTADVVITNGKVYTLDTTQVWAEAIAIKDGKIIAVGEQQTIDDWINESTKVIDVNGEFVMPGFIEGHGHFSRLGTSLIDLNFLKSSSWEEIVLMVAKAAKSAKPGEWIIGGGWHQEKWEKAPTPNIHGYPFHEVLSSISPNNPVLLHHASGHGLFANEKAMALAGVTNETPNPVGGEIVRNNQGEAIGMFEERAMQPIFEAYNTYLTTLSTEEKLARWHKGIRLAEMECLKKGITSFQDAGASFEEIDRYVALAESDSLDLRLWSMIRHSYDQLKDSLDGFPIIDAGDNFFTSRAIKAAVDGALGAFGAWLLAPYNDKPGFVGQNTTSVQEIKNIAELAIANDMQLCVHAIGDRANRVMVDMYDHIFESNPDKSNLRWRIEHAQHLDTTDIPRFKALGIIASMQGIHCTSDAPFVEKRLGYERAKYGAYPWRSLLDNDVIVANGTDAPVEDVDPIQSFYASVTRKRADTGFEFFPEQRMTRAEAIYSYTLGNAYAAFEEKDKGSLEIGKLADIVVLSKDLINCTDEEILNTKIKLTMVDGKIKYQDF